MKLRVCVSMGLQGCEIEDEIEVSDDATEGEIEDEVSEWAHQHVEWWYERIGVAPETAPASSAPEPAGDESISDTEKGGRE